MKNKIGNIQVSGIYNYDQLEGVYLFIQKFRSLPNTVLLYYLDLNKVWKLLHSDYAREFNEVFFTRRLYDGSKGLVVSEFSIVFKTELVVYIEDDVVKILHGSRQLKMVEEMVDKLKKLKQPTKRKPNEMSIITNGRNGFELKTVSITKSKLDLDLYYEEDFKEVDQIIQNRLNKKSDKGMVLLHGIPGTGKTTYLRYLIGRLKKKMIFLPPGMGDAISNPNFVELLMNNRDSILVIEDAENLITDRALNPFNGVSGLLNVSDGLLSDFLSAQVICTFNKPLTMIDDALTREGRLIARYEFGKLSVAKAQRLSDKLGFNTSITEPSTLAEIASQDQRKTKKPARVVLGFGGGINARN